MKGQKNVFVEAKKAVDEARRRLKEAREASRDTDVKSISVAYLEGKEDAIEHYVEVALRGVFSAREKKLNQEHEELKAGMENLKSVTDDSLRRLNILERHFNLRNPEKLPAEGLAKQFPKGDETVNVAEEEKNAEDAEDVEDEMVNAAGVNNDIDDDNKEDSDQKLKEGECEKRQPLEEEADGGSDVEEDEIADDEEEQEEVDGGSDVEEESEGDDEEEQEEDDEDASLP